MLGRNFTKIVFRGTTGVAAYLKYGLSFGHIVMPYPCNGGRPVYAYFPPCRQGWAHKLGSEFRFGRYRCSQRPHPLWSTPFMLLGSVIAFGTV